MKTGWTPEASASSLAISLAQSPGGFKDDQLLASIRVNAGSASCPASLAPARADRMAKLQPSSRAFCADLCSQVNALTPTGGDSVGGWWGRQLASTVLGSGSEHPTPPHVCLHVWTGLQSDMAQHAAPCPRGGWVVPTECRALYLMLPPWPAVLCTKDASSLSRVSARAGMLS